MILYVRFIILYTWKTIETKTESAFEKSNNVDKLYPKSFTN